MTPARRARQAPKAARLLPAALLALLVACGQTSAPEKPATEHGPSAAQAPPGQVDAKRLANLDADPDQWLTPGRDARGTYYSPLEAINDKNVERLGFAWDYELGTKRGLEATRRWGHVRGG
jgi:quinohemoprotein ethanol dehydrogenase